MRLTRNFCSKLVLVVSLILGLFNCLVFVNSIPQWVWNPEANSAPVSQQSSGGGGGGGRGQNKVFFNEGGVSDKEKVPIKIVDTQARLFPTIIAALSNSLNRPNSGGNRPNSGASSPGGGNSGSEGSHSHPSYPEENGSSSSSSESEKENVNVGSSSSAICSGGRCTIQCASNNIGACIGSQIASQAIQLPTKLITASGAALAANPSIFGSFFQNIFGGSGSANTLPGNIINGGGGSFSKEPVVGSCTCVDANACFLPKKATGNCDNGARVSCCSTGTRTYFPDDNDYNRLNSIRSVTRSQIRRQLFRNIVTGSGDVIDNTLDLLLHPFLKKEDQLEVATKVLRDSVDRERERIRP